MINHITSYFTSYYILFIFLLINSACLILSANTSPLTKSPNRGIDIQKVMDYQMPHIITCYCRDYHVSEETIFYPLSLFLL